MQGIITNDRNISLYTDKAGYWLFDPNTHLIHCSQQARRIFGLPLSQKHITPLKFINMVHADDLPILIQLIAQARSSKSTGTEDYRIVMEGNIEKRINTAITFNNSPTANEKSWLSGAVCEYDTNNIAVSLIAPTVLMQCAG